MTRIITSGTSSVQYIFPGANGPVVLETQAVTAVNITDSGGENVMVKNSQGVPIWDSSSGANVPTKVEFTVGDASPQLCAMLNGQQVDIGAVRSGRYGIRVVNILETDVNLAVLLATSTHIATPRDGIYVATTDASGALTLEDQASGVAVPQTEVYMSSLAEDAANANLSALIYVSDFDNVDRTYNIVYGGKGAYSPEIKIVFGYDHRASNTHQVIYLPRARAEKIPMSAETLTPHSMTLAFGLTLDTLVGGTMVNYVEQRTRVG